MIYCITGGTGSLGTALIRLILESQPQVDEIRIVARNEHRLMETAAIDPRRVKIIMGDVRYRPTLERAFKGCFGVFHAAAQKAIDLAEAEPEECWRTNVIGTDNACRAAIAQRVPRLIVVSSDKAVNPLVHYGATKCLAEHLAVAYNANQLKTAIGCVRYGNVVRSQGSVLTVWDRQMARQEPVTLTQAGMTRFFITLPEAARFVLTAMKYLRGGEIFVPRLKSVRLEQMADWYCGKHPRRMIGLRSSEKIHETLISADEVRRTSDVGFSYIVWPIKPRTETLYGRPVKWNREQLLFGYTSRNAEQLTKSGFNSMTREEAND